MRTVSESLDSSYGRLEGFIWRHSTLDLCGLQTTHKHSPTSGLHVWMVGSNFLKRMFSVFVIARYITSLLATQKLLVGLKNSK